MTDIYTMQNGKITEDECVEILNEMKRQSKAMLENPTTFYSQNNILSGCETMKKHIFAYDIAIKALEEIQQYRAIGKVEKVQEYKEIVDNMNAVNMAALCVSLNKLKKYEAIGIIEECRTAVEKQKAKICNLSGDGYADGHLVYDTYECPNCGKDYEIDYEIDYEEYEYCPNCGQHIKRLGGAELSG